MNIDDAMDAFDLSCLTDAAALVDAKLELLDQRAAQSADPESDGIFDRAEYLAGFGLVACQVYIGEAISMSGRDRLQALKLGPQHSCGHSIATLVNATANHWKHASEWKDPLTRRARVTADTIEDLGVDLGASYVAVNALAAIVRPRKHRIRYLIPFLSQWRKSLQSEK